MIVVADIASANVDGMIKTGESSCMYTNSIHAHAVASQSQAFPEKAWFRKATRAARVEV